MCANAESPSHQQHDLSILYHDRAGEDEEGRKVHKKKKVASKTKYTCESCDTKVVYLQITVMRCTLDVQIC